MPFDTHKNLAIGTVLVAPIPPYSGSSLILTGGHGIRFPAPPFNATIWPPSAYPSLANAEVVRVTGMSGDQITSMLRAQEATAAIPVQMGYLIAETITAKALQDIESGVNFPLITTPGPITSSDSVNAPLGVFGDLDGTPLDADQLLSGTVPDARLSVNVLTHPLGYPGGTVTFLRADGTFQTVPINGGIPGLHAPTHAAGGTDPVAVTGLAGYPGNTTDFLRADGTFAVPPGGSGGGGADEVFIGATDPGGTFELWYDTAAVSPSVDYARLSTANTFGPTQHFSTGLRSTGQVASGVGPGVELTLSSSNEGYVNAYDRTASVYKPLIFGAISASFNINGAVRGLMHASGGFSWGSTTDPGAGNFSVAGLIQFQNTSGIIRNNTVDGSDNRYLQLAAGGGGGPTRGGYINCFGNDYATVGGQVELVAGDVASGKILFSLGGPGNVVPRGIMHPSGGFSWGDTTDPGPGAFRVGQHVVAGNGGTLINSNGGMTIATAGTGLSYIQGFVNSNGTVGYIATNGTGTTYSTTSDARLKTDRGRLTNTSVLQQTIVHAFDWKGDGTAGRGVFAQEAHTVAPFAVSVGSDEVDDQGRLTHPWGVDYSKYVPDLIVGWQHHTALIEALLARITALEARLA